MTLWAWFALAIVSVVCQDDGFNTSTDNVNVTVNLVSGSSVGLTELRELLGLIDLHEFNGKSGIAAGPEFIMNSTMGLPIPSHSENRITLLSRTECNTLLSVHIGCSAHCNIGSSSQSSCTLCCEDGVECECEGGKARCRCD
jgi:hypothetical protein